MDTFINQTPLLSLCFPDCGRTATNLPQVPLVINKLTYKDQHESAFEDLDFLIRPYKHNVSFQKVVAIRLSRPSKARRPDDQKQTTWVNVMYAKGSAMTRKIVLASFLAVVLLSGGPAFAAAAKPKTVSNINKSSKIVETDLVKSEDKAKSDSLPDSPASSGPTSILNDATAAQQIAAAQAVPPAPAGLPMAGDTLSNFGPSSGTVVGNRALELRDEVLRMRSSVNLNAGEFSILRSNGAAGAVQYHSTVAAITARLQNGTTRGNPILLRQWEEAEASLNEVTNSLNRLNSLQTSVAADASLASYLLESIQAGFQLSGAVDEDHDQLKLLRDEVSRMIVQLDYLRNQVTDDIQRQTTYLTTERANLQTLAFAITRGELLGSSLANRPVIVKPAPVMMMPQQQSAISPMDMHPMGGIMGNAMAPSPVASPALPVTAGRAGPEPMSPREFLQESGQMNSSQIAPPPASSLPTPDVGVAPTAGRLLVLIRYNQPNVEYEQKLSHAVSMAMQKKTDAEFSVIAVSPSSGDPAELATAQEAARRNAESVKRSLIQLGLAPSRVNVAATQSQDAHTPEVHVYVK